jgi:hypothetical protein
VTLLRRLKLVLLAWPFASTTRLTCVFSPVGGDRRAQTVSAGGQRVAEPLFRLARVMQP